MDGKCPRSRAGKASRTSTVTAAAACSIHTSSCSACTSSCYRAGYSNGTEGRSRPRSANPPTAAASSTCIHIHGTQVPAGISISDNRFHSNNDDDVEQESSSTNNSRHSRRSSATVELRRLRWWQRRRRRPASRFSSADRPIRSWSKSTSSDGRKLGSRRPTVDTTSTGPARPMLRRRRWLGFCGCRCFSCGPGRPSSATDDGSGATASSDPLRHAAVHVPCRSGTTFRLLSRTLPRSVRRRSTGRTWPKVSWSAGSSFPAAKTTTTAAATAGPDAAGDGGCGCGGQRRRPWRLVPATHNQGGGLAPDG